MKQSATHAATKVVQMSSREECALGMGQKLNAAAVTDALMQLRKGECVEDVGHIASHRTNLQHFSFI